MSHGPSDMRLAVEITTCTPLRTGVGYYTEHLVDALLETRHAGDDVVLLSNRAPAPELAERWARHIHISGPSVRAVWMQSAVPRMLADTRADLGVFPNYAAPLASPCPTLVVVHDLAVLRVPHFFTARKRFLSRPMMNLVVAAAPVIGTVSETSERDIIELLGLRPERIALLPGAAHPSCRPATPEQVAAVRERHGLRGRYVLTVGTLEPRKNLPTLLRAFDRLEAETDHELVVVGGRGWKDCRLVQALEARRARRRVRWLGYVPESDLAALYTGADLFVFAPTLEGFGLPLVEAMACGTPVIAADVSALREVGGDAAQYVTPGDDAAFARAIAQVLRDPRGAEPFRAQGLRRAQQFSWTRTAEALWTRARATAPTRIRSDGGLEPESAPTAAPLPPLPPPPPGLGVREWALLATVVYADLFESPCRCGRRSALPSAPFRGGGGAADGRGTGPVAAADAAPEGFLVLASREHLVDPMPEREALDPGARGPQPQDAHGARCVALHPGPRPLGRGGPQERLALGPMSISSSSPHAAARTPPIDAGPRDQTHRDARTRSAPTTSSTSGSSRSPTIATSSRPTSSRRPCRCRGRAHRLPPPPPARGGIRRRASAAAHRSPWSAAACWPGASSSRA